MIEFDEWGGVDLIGIFPSIVTFRVPFPLDQVLQGPAPPPGPMGMYLLHFIFFFPINQIQWRSGEVWPMWLGFSVSRDQTGVEDWVDVPLSREFEPNCHG
jgi:hypothetical protein